MLYNILLPINQYNGSITKNVIAKRFGISHGYFIRSLRNFINLMNISSPHDYADVSY